MKYLLIVLSLIFCLVGCESMPGWKTSEIKEETAEVITMNYIPRSSSTDLNPGMNLKGELCFTMSSNTIPERWVIVFRCSEHNQTFGIQNRQIFDRVKVGETVTLRYVEQIEYYPYAKNEPLKSTEKVIDYHTKQVIVKDTIIER